MILDQFEKYKKERGYEGCTRMSKVSSFCHYFTFCHLNFHAILHSLLLTSTLGISGRVDVVFAIDGSDQVTPSVYRGLKQFVTHALRSYKISPSDTNVGMVYYGGQQQVALTLKDGSNAATVNAMIEALPKSEGQANLVELLGTIDKQVFVAQAGSRPGAGKVLVLLTTGDNRVHKPSEIENVARLLHARDIRVIVVGVGSGIDNSQLMNIADDPSNAFHVNYVEYLPGLYGDVEKQVAQITSECHSRMWYIVSRLKSLTNFISN